MFINSRKLTLAAAVLPLCVMASSTEAAVSSRTNPFTGEIEIQIEDIRGIDKYTIINPATNKVEETNNGGCQSDIIVPLGLFKDHDHTHFVDYTPCDESPTVAWMTHYYPTVFDGDPWVPGVFRQNQNMLVTRESTGALSIFGNQRDSILPDKEMYTLNPAAPQPVLPIGPVRHNKKCGDYFQQPGEAVAPGNIKYCRNVAPKVVVRLALDAIKDADTKAKSKCPNVCPVRYLGHVNSNGCKDNPATVVVTRQYQCPKAIVGLGTN